MAYRVILLNGERRGERWDTDKAPLIIGHDSAATLQLPDPEVAPRHAELVPQEGVLHVRALGENRSFLVNGVETRDATLHHGDVVQIGATRLFIQALGTMPAGDTFAGLRKYRPWIVVGIPIALVMTLAMTLHQCRLTSEAPPAPPAPVVRQPDAMDPYPDDGLATNLPRIQIDDSVILTSRPPEIVEALELMLQLQEKTDETDNSAALLELEQATRFLTACGEQELAHQAATNQTAGTTDLIQATHLLDGDSRPSLPDATNSTPAAGTDGTITNSTVSAPPR